VQHCGLADLARRAGRRRAPRAVALAITLGTVMVLAAPALAERGHVAGEVTLAPEAQRGVPPVRSEGFVARAQNPLKPVEAYDPRPYLVVVLEGGPAGGPSPRIEYAIEGSSFTGPVLPVQAGVPFEITNRSAHSPRLFAVGAADVLAGEPLNPRGTQSATFSEAYRPIRIRDRDSAHLEATVVAFPHPYFSRVSSDGRFEVDEIPAGTYTARVWYRDGWLNTRPEQVTVSAGGQARVQIAIPPRLEVTTPTSDGATE
jgi:hypothetical protein